MKPKNEKTYPNFEIRKEKDAEWRAISEFLMWANFEKSVTLIRYCSGSKILNYEDVENLMCEYFGINIKVYKKEQQKFFAEYRKKQEQNNDANN